MERIWKFTAFVVLMEVAAAIVIKMAGGKPFGSMSGWSGIGLLIGVMAFLALIGGLAYVVVHNSFNKQVEIGLTVGIVLCVVLMIGLFGTVGLDWLQNMSDAFKNDGLWWPVVMLVACVTAWVLKLGRR